jgi:DNA-binding transcriptional ArsR family regulator
VGLVPGDKIVRILFGARLPQGAKSSSTQFSRSEVLVRLSALADDNRLRILEVLAKEKELYAQDVISRLGLSQSAASRHLRQLSATGYITERTLHGAKCYTLNNEQINHTFQILRQFLTLA